MTHTPSSSFFSQYVQLNTLAKSTVFEKPHQVTYLPVDGTTVILKVMNVAEVATLQRQTLEYHLVSWANYFLIFV
jgi:hypothetical protein